MKVVQFSAFGPPHEVAACVEVPDPGPPARDEVVVEVEAFPINPADLLTIAGGYATRPPLPATPGAEGVGRVVAAGAGVDHVGLGDRVLLLCRENWDQRRTCKANEVLKLPGDGDALQFAMLKVNPATAWLMLTGYVELRPGDWVIQDAANSGVGTNLIRLARAEGWKTVNVVRRPELVDTLRERGADVVVVDGPDLAERVRAETGAAGIRLGIDAVAGEVTLRLVDCLADGGTLVNYGMLTGRPCMVSPSDLVFRSITLTGFWLAKELRRMSYDRIATLYADLVRRMLDGQLWVEVEATYPIEEIKAALEHAGRGGRGGKILVTPDGAV
ncbi:MAG TPA: zinc-dependent alcohol dehydrogenase family protein [Geminicoccaceae bacterium]|nr:zinc-dependent alcohol dehydrogenase family protein [Geminicoccaceae bacterium]